MRGWSVLLVGFAMACSTSRRNPTAERHDAARAIAVLRGIPVVSERLRPDAALIPATLGVTLEKPGMVTTIIPLTARAPMRITRGSHTLDIVAEHDTDARGAIESGAMVYANASRDVDAYVIAEPDRVEELRVYRSGPVVARWRMRVDGSMALHGNLVEARDSKGSAFLRSEPIFAVDSRGTKRVPRLVLSRDGETYRLEAELDTRELTYPIALDPGWGPTGALSVARIRHAGVKLTDGKILVAGGQSELTTTGILSTAEIYDPTAGTWTLTGSMKVPRTWHGMVLLGDGKAMVLGGLTTGSCVETLTTEIYDPTAGTWTDGPALPAKRYLGYAHYVGGKVVYVGGRNCTNGLKDAAVLDVTAGTWSTSTSLMADERIFGASSVVGSKVLVTGGKLAAFGNTFDSAELFDPSTKLFTPTPKMSSARVYHSQTTLLDGRAMVAGGKPDDSSSSAPLLNGEIFDPVTLAWTSAPGLTAKHWRTPITTLSNGKVLIVAGDGLYASPLPTDSETWDPTTGAWSLAGKVTNLRANHLLFPLAGGSAIAVGGDVGVTTSGARTLTATVDLFADGITTGSKCGSGGQCATGYCVDGVCCNEACTGKCQSCTGGTCTSLTAPAPGKGTCDPYVCGASDCKTTCTADTDCIATSYCNKTTSKCELRIDKGAACTTASQCKTGYCVGGYCCNEACTGACQVCNQSGSFGTCVTVTGTDACAAPPDTGTDAGSDTEPATDSATTSDTSVTPPGDGEIADGGTKLPAQPVIVGEFTRCNVDSECSTGHCVEGVCCNTECLDKCHSCALISSPGICTPSPLGVDMRNDCGPALKCLGTCNGGGQCIGAGAGTTCARNRCTTQSEGVGAAYCQSPGGKCDTAAAVPFKCDPYVCEPAFGACRSSCKNSLDCVNGFVCDVTSKTCLAPAPSDEEGGCAMGHSRETGVGFFALLAAMGLISRRRRR
jgi:hypothetical protein